MEATALLVPGATLAMLATTGCEGDAALDGVDCPATRRCSGLTFVLLGVGFAVPGS